MLFWSSPTGTGGLVEQDVGRHQDRIDVEPDRGVLAVLAGLLLELGHAVEPADAGDAVEDPGKLRMGGHLALVEDDVLAGVDAGREITGRHLARLRTQQLRVLPRSDGVLIDDAIDAVELVLQPHPVPDGAEIVAEMEVLGGLDAREDAAHGRCGPLVFAVTRGLGIPRRWPGVIATSVMAVKPPGGVRAGDRGIRWRWRRR
jgi:hypothetical protein